MLKLIVASATVFGVAALAHGQALVSPLGFRAEAISPDGRVVVGSTLDSSNAAYWTRDTGIHIIGNPLDLTRTKAYAVSGDGSIIVGVANAPTGFIGWKWTQSTGLVPLTVPGATSLQATCISRDGSTIGGAAIDSSHFYKGFVWTQADGGRFVPQGVNYATWLHFFSPNGTRVCGSGSSGGGTWPMFWGSTYVWCESLGPVTGWAGGVGLAMTPDGSTIVGDLTGSGGQYNRAPFVWTAQDGMTVVDRLPGHVIAELETVSDDGLIAGGYQMDSTDHYSAVIWRKGVGLILADSYFAARNVSTPPLTEIVGISANGRIFCDRGSVIDLGACGSADFNHDGSSGTDADIEAFFGCLGGDCCPQCDNADFNSDGDSATDADIEAFFRVVAGGSC
jgi:hypothetical protein